MDSQLNIQQFSTLLLTAYPSYFLRLNQICVKQCVQLGSPQEEIKDEKQAALKTALDLKYMLNKSEKECVERCAENFLKVNKRVLGNFSQKLIE